MSRFDEKRSWGYDAQSSLTHTFQNTQAMGDAIEALETQTQIDRDNLGVALRRIGDIDERLISIAADLSRLEQRTALPPKPEPLAEGEYVVRWRSGNHREVARCIGGRWFEDCGTPDDVRVNWLSRPAAPHWIGPRVDLPK